MAKIVLITGLHLIISSCQYVEPEGGEEYDPAFEVPLLKMPVEEVLYLLDRSYRRVSLGLMSMERIT
jgi:PBP1b-binding outer membrane lipoprotein LpoB